MARASKIQNAFDSGELSSLLLGRQDFDKYDHGMFVCLNGLPLVQGPWTRRPGTAFLHQCKYSDKPTRLFPFQFSTTDTYVLEYNNFDGAIRFYTDHGILTQASQSITAITKANPGVVTKVAHGYVDNARLQLHDVLGMTQLNNMEVQVRNSTADTFELWTAEGNLFDPIYTKIDTTNFGTFTSGSMAKIFEVGTGLFADPISQVRFTQSADAVYITHPSANPLVLTRASALSWSIAALVFTDGPYDKVNTTTTTLTPSAATGNITLTASAVTGINGGTGFVSTDVGRLIRLQEGTTWGYVQITAFTDTTHVNATVLSTLTNTNAKLNWRMGVWSNTTGWPACSAFYEDRLYFAGASSFPQRFDGSNVGQYTNFSPSATDGTVSSANAVSGLLNSDDVNAIRWMSPHDKGLLIGTTRSEWLIRATTQGEAVTPTNITYKVQTSRGSANAAAVRAARTSLFIQRGGRKLREMAFRWEVDGFMTPDLAQLAEHITSPSITELAYQEQPQAIVWAIRSDGVLLGMTYDRDAGVVAWHRHELGGSSTADGLTIPLVTSMAVVVDPTETRDELYLIVNRYINGGTKQYIEYMSNIWAAGDVQEDAFYVDSGTTSLTASTTTVTGLLNHEGETLAAYVDGTRQPNVVVTNGTATLTTAGTIKTLGYSYTSDGQTMPLDGGSQDGSAQSKTKKISRLGFWLLDTLGLKYGPDADTLTELIVRKWGDAYGTATPLFTGVVRERFEGDYDKLGQVYWRADGPFPANVLAVMPQFEVSDDS
jgi:hypothetical protein